MGGADRENGCEGMIVKIVQHSPISLTVSIDINLNDALGFHKFCKKFGAHTIPAEEEIVEKIFKDLLEGTE